METTPHRPGWPVLKSLRGYGPAALPRDLVAGLTLAAIVIPEQMATARLAGLPPQAGFFAFIAAAVAFLLFGPNRFMSVGADSTIAPIFAGGLVALAAVGSPAYPQLATVLALMVGVIVLVAGLARMGWIANLLSEPVTIGFLAGVAVHIFASQAPGALGLPGGEGPLPRQLLALALALPRANLAALAIAVGVGGATAVAHLVNPRVPGALVGLVAATAATIVLHLDAHGVAVLGGVPAGLASLTWPGVSFAQALSLAPLALLVALVVMVQTGAVARSFPSDPETPPDISGDYVGLGVANLAAGLFGGFPVNASPPRTGVTAESGGRSQLAGLTAAAVVVALLLFGTGLLTHVPRAALAGVLLFVAARIVRVKAMRDVARASLTEFLLILATAAAIIVLPIQIGAAAGIGLSLLHGMWSSVQPHSYRLHRVPGTTVWWPTTPHHTGETLEGVVVVGFASPLTFFNADALRRCMLAALDGGTRLIVLEATGIISVDYTAAQTVKDVVQRCRDAGCAFAIARLEAAEARHALRRFGVTACIGEDHLFDTVNAAVTTLAPDAKPA